MTSKPSPLDLTEKLIAKAISAGADAADALVFESQSMDVSFRLGKLEEVERSESHDLGLRVFFGKRQASVSSTDFSDRILDELVDRAVAMAQIAPEDPHCGLAPKDRLATDIPDLDLEDPTEISSDQLAEYAATAEAAALQVAGITNSDGASASWGKGGVTLATSEGFSGAYASTSFSISCAVIAGEGDKMEMNYDYDSKMHLADLDDAAKIGKSAAERALRALNPRRVSSQSVPIVYDNRLSRSIISHLAGAISGASVARGTSFLKDRMGEQLFDAAITISDDPLVKRGHGSKPFDGEGVALGKLNLIDDGVLTTWLLDCASASKLGLATNGRAARGTGGPPHPSTTNLTLLPGSISFDDLIGDIQNGLYVNNMFGPSVNPTTGDYSVGVSGLWIENGKLAYPVNEITIAGNLIKMFKNLTPADDLVIRGAANAPTLRIEGMTVAGN